MKTSTAILLGIPVAALGAACVLSGLRAEFELPSSGNAPAIIVADPKHTATPAMLAATNAMESRAAPTFRAVADDGGSDSVEELAQSGPLALVFIKDGCPCSVAAGPFYSRLAEGYGSRVRFFGVIDGDVEVARRWARANRVSFPILCDPNLRIVHEYKAENSAYFAIIAPGGTIEKYWPGDSADMLKEANAQLARLAGVEPRPVDMTDAPAEMDTGCPY